MWNGFWKLTVMVGVVGIGLFAVFQAQQGMSRFASLNSTQATSDDDPKDASSTSDSAGSDQTGPLTVSLDARQDRSLKSNQASPRSASDRVDLVGNFATNSSATASKVKPAVGSAKSSSPKVTLATREPRQHGLSFLDDEELSEDDSNMKAAQPEALPAENSFEELLDTPPLRTSRPSDTLNSEEPPAAPEATEDPFETERAPSRSKNTSAANGPAKSTAPDAMGIPDFGDESAIPRSKRGLERSRSKSEADNGISDPFSNEPKAMDAPPALDPDAEESDSPLSKDSLPAEDSLPAADDAFPTVDAPAADGPDLESPAEDTPEPEQSSPATPALERFDQNEELEPSKPVSIRKSGPADAPRSLPTKLPDFSDDEPLPTRSLPSRTRPGLPLNIDGDSDDKAPDRRSHDSVKPKASPNRVTPVDLIGDGVAGDESQRGLQQPRLTIEKVAQQQAVLDRPLVFTIIVRNNGTVAAHNVVIEDRIPKGTELIGSDPRAELVGKSLIWKEPILRPNEEKKISIKVIPKQEGPIGSVARVHFATEVTAEIQVAAPQLEFTVNAPTEVRIGHSFDMVFQLKNTGKVEASNISVRDLVPEHLKHETGNDIECPIGKLAPNEVREIVLTVTAIKTGSGTNSAVMTADGGIKKQHDSPIDVVGDHLVLSRTGHNRVYVERTAVFTNMIRNEGNLSVSKVRIAEVVPAGMEFETASDGGKYDAKLKSVVWSVGPLAPGDDREVTVTYIPKETGTLAGKITATGATGSTAAITSTVDVIGRPELQMETLSATGLVTVGDRITSKFQLKNAGTAPARNVQLRIQLPPELRLVSVSGARYQKDKNSVIFETIDELAPRSNAAFELILEPMEEAETRVIIEIAAEHLKKPHRREESIQIAPDSLK